MSLLHPYFIIAIIYMLFFSIQEVFGNKVEKKWFWFLAIYLVLLAGLRDNVGPDYGSYKMIYLYSGSKEYINIFLKALHLEGSENVDLEWLYALINKVLLNVFNAPYYVLTLVIAIFAIFFKVEYTDDNTFYPFTFTLFMFIPNFFIEFNCESAPDNIFKTCKNNKIKKATIKGITFQINLKFFRFN
jgi:hypothetical protein